jgi:ankyrin repeat protein
LLIAGLSITVSAAGADDARLVEAAKNRDAAAVRTLLKERVNVNSRHANGVTALHWAAHWGDRDTANILIRAGADVNTADDLGVTPLELACRVADAAMVKLLLTAGASPNTAADRRGGETPLMIASRTGNIEAVRALVAAGADVNATEKTQGQTALMWAAAERHTDIVRLLIEVGADINARSKGRYTALLFSARANDIETARALLAAGASVNDADDEGNSALVVATLMGNTAIARFLLENGADVNAAEGGFTALHWAVGHWDHGFSGPFGLKAEDSEWSAISGLRGDAKLEFAKLLLSHGADVNAQLTKSPPRGGTGGGGLINLPLQGATPYLLASNAADVRLMRLLLDNGADPKPVLKNGTTALMLALGITRAIGATFVTESQAMEAAKLAIELGSDVNATNVTGDTAMHAAAYSGFNNIISLLVEEGASLNPKNKRGHTPYLIANGQGPRTAGDIPYQPNTAAFLRKIGADTTGHCDWPCATSANTEGDEYRPRSR